MPPVPTFIRFVLASIIVASNSGMVRDGLMIECEEAFLDGIPSMLASWDRIPVTMSEATNLHFVYN